MTNRFPVVCVVATAVVIQTGCSGAKQSQTHDATKADFIMKGDAICRADGAIGERIIGRIQRALEKAKTKKEVSQAFAAGQERLAGLVRRERHDLGTLEVPPDARRRWY